LRQRNVAAIPAVIAASRSDVRVDGSGTAKNWNGLGE
jgi:hypothetical protein